MLVGCVTQRGFPPEHQIVNFDYVDALCVRGAQPTANGFRFLKSQGVGAVFNLRDDPLPNEQAEVEALGMIYVPYPLSGTAAPTVTQMNKLQDQMDALNRQGIAVFVHCQFGCDRTGATIAGRRVRKGWDNRKALDEAIAYGLSPWLPNFRHFILVYPVYQYLEK